MPHKHTRKDHDASTFDLPPSVVAKPLPVSKSAAANGIFTTQPEKRSKKRKRNNDNADDTPKAFARLMAMAQGKKVRSGLDDGTQKPQGKKAKKNGKESAGANEGADADAATSVPDSGAATATGKPALTIRPGERLSDFAARVDRELPVSQLLVKKGNKDPLGMKVKRTRKEQKMHKLYDEWRVQDAKIKAAREEALEEADNEDLYDEDAAQGGLKAKIDMAYEAQLAAKKKKKNKKKSKGATGDDQIAAGGADDDGGDPWAALAKKRSEAPRKLNDFAQAPPELKKPREIFKPRSTKDVPRAAGDALRRQELSNERQNIVESYRAMMKK